MKRKKKSKIKILPSIDPRPAKSYSAASGRFSHSWSHLSVLFHDQLTYLDELNGKCNGTARACVNSGYQALFSPITEHLGTRLVLYTRPDACHKGTHSALHTGFFSLGGGGGACP